MSDVTSLYFSTPPVARTVATAVFISSVGVYTGMLDMYGFFFHYSMLLKFPPSVHRLITSFLITSKDLGVLFDTYFIYNYLSQLEKSNPKFSKKEDLIWYLMFISSVIIRFLELRKITPHSPTGPSFANLIWGQLGVWAWWDVLWMTRVMSSDRSLGWFLAPYILSIIALLVNSLLTGAVLYLPALLIGLCYTATQDQRGMQAHFYVVTVPAQLMPWCMLLAQLLFAGPNSFLLGLTGIFAAHLHDFLTRIYPTFGYGPNLIPTPGFVSWILRSPRTRYTGYGTSYAPPVDNSGRGGPLPDSWRSKGPGRRLG